MPPTSAPSPCGARVPPAGPGDGGKCAVEHESVARKDPSGWSPYAIVAAGSALKDLLRHALKLATSVLKLWYFLIACWNIESIIRDLLIVYYTYEYSNQVILPWRVWLRFRVGWVSGSNWTEACAVGCAEDFFICISSAIVKVSKDTVVYLIAWLEYS